MFRWLFGMKEMANGSASIVLVELDANIYIYIMADA